MCVIMGVLNAPRPFWLAFNDRGASPNEVHCNMPRNNVCTSASSFGKTPLERFRQQMAANRLACTGNGEVNADFSPVGSGKSRAEICLMLRNSVRDAGFLVLMPTHRQCQQMVSEGESLGAGGIIPWPQLSPDSCDKYEEAEQVMNKGYSFRLLCPTCPHRKECLYNKQFEAARAAIRSVATHKRGEIMIERMAEGKDYITGHEDVMSIVRPTLQCTTGLEEVARIAKRASYRLHSSQVMQEYDVFYETMVLIAKELERIMRKAEKSRQIHSFTPSLVVPSQYEYMKHLYEADDEKGPHRDAMEIVLGCAVGKVDNLMVFVDRTGKGNTRRAICARFFPILPYGTTIMLNDATGVLAHLEQALGRPINDITPDVKLEMIHPVVQIPLDVTGKTAESKAVNILRGVLYDLPYQRIGLITHRKLLYEFDNKLEKIYDKVGRSLTDRLRMVDYFHSGSSRGSNDWIRECDCLVVLGTPRIPAHEIRDYLVKIGRFNAASLPLKDADKWVAKQWTGFTANGVESVISSPGYTNADWAEAYEALVTAEIHQSVGRARSILPEGIPCFLISTEKTIPLNSSIVGCERGYTIAPHNRFWPINDTQYSILQAMVPDHHYHGNEIAEKVSITKQSVSRQMIALCKSGRVIQSEQTGKGGWTRPSR